MMRIKALFRARGIRALGRRVYAPQHRAQWLAELADPGARFRAETLLKELDVLRELRPRAKAAMIAEARRDPAWHVLRSIPFLGPVRVALLLVTMKTPWRFRTKRNLWAYAGLAVVTQSSSDHTFIAGRPVRRQRKPLTRGLNQNHNRILKDVFKGAATSAIGRSDPSEISIVRSSNAACAKKWRVYAYNLRRPRRTRRSVRPAACRVSDRTMVRTHATHTLRHSSR
jgi:transposase